jgi:acetyltransferase-like isoleucine patch superfamily enzyme
MEESGRQGIKATRVVSTSRDQFTEFLEQKVPAITKTFTLAKDLGTHGYSLPSLQDMCVFEASANSIPALAERGISLGSPHGAGNYLLLDSNVPKLDLKINFHGKSSSFIMIGNSVAFSGSLNVKGDRDSIIFSGVAGHQGRPNVRVDIGCSDGHAFFGREFTSVGSHWLLEGDGTRMVTGDDCMLSWEIFVRNYDSHAVFEVETLDIVNPAKDLRIGPHCWIGQRAIIAKGVHIGYGTIVGIASVVTSDLPELCAAGGVPARILRTGVSWSRSRNPDVSTRSTIATDPNRFGK